MKKPVARIKKIARRRTTRRSRTTYARPEDPGLVVGFSDVSPRMGTWTPPAPYFEKIAPTPGSQSDLSMMIARKKFERARALIANLSAESRKRVAKVVVALLARRRRKLH